MLFPKACRNSPPRMGWFPAFERYLKQRRCFQESIFHNTEVKAMSQSLVKQPKFCDINTCGRHTGTAFTAKVSQTALSHLFKRITSWKKSTSFGTIIHKSSEESTTPLHTFANANFSEQLLKALEAFQNSLPLRACSPRAKPLIRVSTSLWGMNVSAPGIPIPIRTAPRTLTTHLSDQWANYT